MKNNTALSFQEKMIAEAKASAADIHDGSCHLGLTVPKLIYENFMTIAIGTNRTVSGVVRQYLEDGASVIAAIAEKVRASAPPERFEKGYRKRSGKKAPSKADFEKFAILKKRK